MSRLASSPAGPRPAALLLCGLLSLLTACEDDDGHHRRGAVPAPVVTGPAYWPTTDWQSATPEAHGFAAGTFDNVDADAATQFPNYTSLLVVKDGYLVHESYHTPSGSGTTITAATKHQLWSVTKSVTSLTLGTAWTQGDLLPGDLDATVDDAFAPLIADLADLPADAPQRDIRLRDTLQMRSGLRWNESWDFTAENPLFYTDPSCTAGSTAVVLCNILHRDQTYTPGTVWNYSTQDSYLISAFFYALTGQSLADYAAAHLFAPLGIGYVAGDWSDAPTGSGITYGGAALQMTSRDMAKIGLLMQYGGRWEDEQLLATDWLSVALAPIGLDLAATFDNASTPVAGEPVTPVLMQIPYSFQWWHSADPGDVPGTTLGAHGLFGQWIYIDPPRGLVIVVTTAVNAVASPFTEYQAFVDNEILAGLAD